MSRASLSIRYRVLALTLLPMTLLALVLGTYFTLTRVSENRATLLERGNSIVRLMTSAAEFGVLSGNVAQLKSLAAGSIRHGEVSDILFYDKAFRLLYRDGEFDIWVNRTQQTPQLIQGMWYFVEPIRVEADLMLESPELAPLLQRSETIGWVAVLISAESSIARENQILLRSIGLTLAGLVIALLLANSFGSRVTDPIIGLTRLIERLQRGDLSARASAIETGELRTLADGINRLAARVQESNQQFEYRVESATRRLTQTLRHLEKRNQDLLTARLRADEANRAKDEFLARMSHELRTPLTSVIGFADLLAQSRLNPEQQEYVRIVNRTSELLLAIIDDILDFSRLESNAITIEAIDFCPRQCLLNVIDSQAPRAFGKGLELIADLPLDLPTRVVGDPNRLTQVLNNLVGNAIKFTSRGEVCVRAQIKRKLNDRGWSSLLQIEVSDTGIGIPHNRLDQLFTAFSQADNSISRRFGGSGLGLVIARHLTELMGGEIHLQSEEGIGTRVQLTLPLQIQTHTLPPICIDMRPPRLYVFEPNPHNRRALLRLLSPYLPSIEMVEQIEQFPRQVNNAQPALLLASLNAADYDIHAIEKLHDRIRRLTPLPLILLLPSRSHHDLALQDTQLVSKPARLSRLLPLLNFELPNSVQSPAEPEPAQLQLPYPLQILVAEDNDFNRLLIRRLLEGMGAQVNEVSNGQAVLDYLADTTPDLILMDVHMPVMDGIEATRQVRLRRPDLPVIALTANVVPHEHKELMNAGITDLLLKPIDVPVLLDVLLQQCELKTGQRSLPAPMSKTLRNALRNLAEPAALHEEVRRLAKQALEATTQQDRKQVRNCAHQLIGIAGLYEKPVLEDCTAAVHEAAASGSMRALWYAVSRLERIAAQEALE